MNERKVSQGLRDIRRCDPGLYSQRPFRPQSQPEGLLRENSKRLQPEGLLDSSPGLNEPQASETLGDGTNASVVVA